MKEDHRAWCRGLFARMKKDGGFWGLPRTGLGFIKTGDELVWTAIFPPQPPLDRLPVFAQMDLREGEFEGVRKMFKKAGIVVRRADDLAWHDSIGAAAHHYNPESKEVFYTPGGEIHAIFEDES